MRVKQLFFLVMAGVFLFTGCNNLADKRNQVKEDDVIDDILPEKSESEPKIAYLKISGAEIANPGRTIKPEFSLDSISNFAFVLSGEKSDDIGNILGIASFENYEQLMEKPIPIEEGLWNLTLTASAEGTILKGIKNNVTIVSGDNSLDFVLKWDSEASTGNGKLELTFDFSQATTRNEVAAVTGEIVKYNPATREESSLEDWIYGYLAGEQNISSHYSLGWDVGSSGEYEYTFSFPEMNPLSAGTYIAKIRLYADSEKTIPINTWRETLIISGGQTSSATRSVSSLNKVYSITYYDGDENISAGFQTKYTRICSDITLPTPIKSGYAFFGWYTKPDFSDEKVTTIPKGSTGDLELYAKWEVGVIISIEQTDLDLTYEMKDDNIIFTVAGGENDYIWYIDGEEKQVSENNEFIFQISETGTYEVEVISGSYSATAFVQFGDTKLPNNPISSEDYVYVKGETICYNEASSITPESMVFLPGRTITIPNMYVGKHEITQSEYEQYCSYGGEVPDTSYGLGENYPAYYINWYDTIVYCNLRSMAEKLTPAYSINNETDPTKWEGITRKAKYYGPSSSNSAWDNVAFNTEANGWRLPTEAEWEYLARAGNVSGYTYSGGDVLNDVAWNHYNSSGEIHEVMTKTANTLELYDMSGNVSEWCWDWYGEIYADTVATGPASGSVRILRGGDFSCDNYYNQFAVATRTDASPEDDYPYKRYLSVGFRVVRNAD